MSAADVNNSFHFLGEVNKSSNRNNRKNILISLYKLEHHCRFCGNIFCRACCRVRASYPVWFGYDKPQLVCENCIPILFDSRQQSAPKKKSSNGKLRRSSSPKIGRHGYVTSGQEVVSLPLRFLHPLCRFAFWFSGMYEGGSFDRRFINAAASMNLPFVGEPVKSIKRVSIRVPKRWPSYGETEASTEAYSISNYSDTELIMMPLLIFTPNTKRETPLPILVRNYKDQTQRTDLFILILFFST